MKSIYSYEDYPSCRHVYLQLVFALSENNRILPASQCYVQHVISKRLFLLNWWYNSFMNKKEIRTLNDDWHYLLHENIFKICNYISEKIHYIHLWVTPLQRETIKVYFWVYTFFSKFQCGLPWWYDKYPDNIRPCSTLLEGCLLLP
jgi:hypothetical protein